MVLDSIRTFNHAVPFRPYVLHMTSGEEHLVPHPDFLSIGPKGQLVVLIDEQERPHHLDTRLIEEAKLARGGRSRRRAA